jgi:DNA (cytosine-5)-methyltransferase 1
MFTGIGGFELGIQRSKTKAECIGYSEIDKFSIKTYETHYPKHKNYGDATKINPEELPDFDVLCGGFPCQAFSIAGKRMGFEDTRGTLFFDIARIVKRKKPRLLFLENVKGLLSHDNGRTFATILATLDELGYNAEWEVLNSKNFGVPQNRERVFIIGHLRGTSSRQIFPLGNCDGKDNASRESEESYALTSSYHKGDRGGYVKVYNDQDKRWVDKKHIGTIEGHSQSRSGFKVCVPGTLRTHKEDKGFREMNQDVSPAIPARAREDGSGQPCITVLTPDRPEKRQNGRRFKGDGDEMFTLTGQDIHGVMIRKNQYGKHQQDAVFETENSISPTLMSSGDGHIGGASAGYLRYNTKMGIRRLTPIECERLQGFPDNWTVGSDTQRYKQCGNAVTVNVIQAIAERLIPQLAYGK